MGTNQEILAEINKVVEEDSDNEKNENDDDEPVAKQGIEEVRKTVQIFKNFSSFSQFNEAMLKALKDINCGINKAL